MLLICCCLCVLGWYVQYFYIVILISWLTWFVYLCSLQVLVHRRSSSLRRDREDVCSHESSLASMPSRVLGSGLVGDRSQEWGSYPVKTTVAYCVYNCPISSLASFSELVFASLLVGVRWSLALVPKSTGCTPRYRRPLSGGSNDQIEYMYE